MSLLSDFIIANENADTDKILLRKDKYPDMDVNLAVNSILGRRRMRAKAPSWYDCAEVLYPDRLCTEQCSSEKTAEIKAKAIFEECGIPEITEKYKAGRLRVADLTGGLGVDSSVFARGAEAVLYNEVRQELAEAAEHNFKALGRENVRVCNQMIFSGSEEFIRVFQPDVIYLDPARRAADGKKVFLLEDCQPDILKIKDTLLENARLVAVKLSPMADISMVAERLGRRCRQIEVISSENECKELIALLDREFEGECTIVANCGGRSRFVFTLAEEAAAVARYSEGVRDDYVGNILLEPDKAVMKAAPFKLLSSRLGLLKADVSTHYYFTRHPELGSGSVGKIPHQVRDDSERMWNLFKAYRVVEMLPLDKKNMKRVTADYPEAEVTARNIPMSSDELRKRLRVKPSNRFHIFGLGISKSNFLVVTERIR